MKNLETGIGMTTEYLGLSIRAEIFLITIGILFSFFIIRQLKKKRLDEKYTVFWFLIALLLITLPMLSPIIDKIAFLFGFKYPPTLIFLIVILILIVKLLHYSMELSRLSKQNQMIAQKLAIQENEIDRIKKKIAYPE